MDAAGLSHRPPPGDESRARSCPGTHPALWSAAQTVCGQLGLVVLTGSRVVRWHIGVGALERPADWEP